MYWNISKGKTINNFKKSIVVLIKIKGTQKSQKKYKTLTLTLASKIITEIIKNKIEKIKEKNLANDRFEFKKNIGTREPIFTLRVEIEK